MKYNKCFLIIFLIVGIISSLILSRFVSIEIKVHPRIMRVLSKVKHFPGKLVNTRQDKEVLELCYFENSRDIKKCEKNKTQIQITKDKASEGKYSLKCIFPDGGGAVGFYATLPKDWTGYSAFRFDVYSEEDDVPLSLFITDTNNATYNTRYNKERIFLEKGWNNIEISVSEIDAKLALNKITHLNLFLWKVKGKHILYFDNFRLISKDNNGMFALTERPIEIMISPNKKLRKINPLLYGSNLSPKMESDQKIKKFIKNIGITCFRYPGGGSPGWHWKTETADFNPRVKHMFLGGVDYLIDFCKETNTKIIMQVNIESGTPQEAAELVEFINKKSSFRVEYWELGNEVYGNWDKAHTTPQKYAMLIKEYSLVMKAVDPTIKIGANWAGRYYDHTKWDKIIIKEAADYIDFISVHWYPNHIDEKRKFKGRIHPAAEEVTGNSMEIPNIIKRFNKIVQNNAPHRNGKIEITFLEWDGAWDAPSSNPGPIYAQGIAQWSLANAIFYADSLGLFAENGVTVAAHYTLQECPFGLIRGWNRAEGWGGMRWDQETIRPKAYALKMFSEHFGDTLIKSKVANSPHYYKSEDWWADSYSGKVPYATCYASKFSNEKKIGIILVNKHSKQDFDLDISLEDVTNGEKKCNIWILTGPDIMSQNDGSPDIVKIEQIEAITMTNKFKYNLPKHSIVAMEIEL